MIWVKCQRDDHEKTEDAHLTKLYSVFLSVNHLLLQWTNYLSILSERYRLLTALTLTATGTRQNNIKHTKKYLTTRKQHAIRQNVFKYKIKVNIVTLSEDYCCIPCL